MEEMFRIFPDVHVNYDPYPVQFGSGDWITVITRATGTFTGEPAGSRRSDLASRPARLNQAVLRR
jgi:hypothetical protein